mmetsp:Transcript_115016/g.228972  ORF Transcript_115016/g.228972 Transcript_115016/m.228972 type:complete len:207 (-) Transcript_115016:51-671(-)
MPTTALDLTQGITEYSSRMALKMLFGQFGEVTACWIPPLEHRGSERAYVKFNTTKSAQAALDAANAGHLYLDGVCLRAEWRLAPARTQDSRDFEARGSNLMTSRDLMRAEAKKAREERGKFRRGKEHNDTADEKERKPRDRHRSRDASRKRRSRSRDRRRRDRSHSRRSSNRRRARSRSRGKSEEPAGALEDKRSSDVEEVTSAVI